MTRPYLACAGRGHLRISIRLIWIIILTVVARQQSYCFQRQLHRVLWCMGIHMLTIVWALCNKFMIGYEDCIDNLRIFRRIQHQLFLNFMLYEFYCLIYEIVYIHNSLCHITPSDVHKTYVVFQASYENKCLLRH